jgi:hypothetical protein
VIAVLVAGGSLIGGESRPRGALLWDRLKNNLLSRHHPGLTPNGGRLQTASGASQTRLGRSGHPMWPTTSSRASGRGVGAGLRPIFEVGSKMQPDWFTKLRKPPRASRPPPPNWWRGGMQDEVKLDIAQDASALAADDRADVVRRPDDRRAEILQARIIAFDRPLRGGQDANERFALRHQASP